MNPGTSSHPREDDEAKEACERLRTLAGHLKGRVEVVPLYGLLQRCGFVVKCQDIIEAVGN